MLTEILIPMDHFDPYYNLEKILEILKLITLIARISLLLTIFQEFKHESTQQNC